MGHEPFELPNMLRQDNLRRKALTAASSVVLAFGLGACVTKSPEDEDKDDQSYSAIGDDGDTDDGGETGGGDTDDGGETGGGETGDSGGTDSGEDTGSGDTGMEDTGTPGAPDCYDVASEDRAECCDALWEWCTEIYGEDEDALYECAWGDESGCTPWGPPVPPQARMA